MQGLLVVVSGFSGVGKGTLMKELIHRYPDSYALSISATSRLPRTGEENGREYFFKTDAEFEEMLENDELIEYCRYAEHYYGTPRKYVEEQMAAGKNVILEIEVQGGRQIKQKFPDAFLLFVLPPSAQELSRRLTGRGTETADVIRTRLSRAVEEAEYVSNYDETTVNDDLDTCVEEIHRMLLDQQKKLNDRKNTVETIKNDLQVILKGEN